MCGQNVQCMWTVEHVWYAQQGEAIQTNDASHTLPYGLTQGQFGQAKTDEAQLCIDHRRRPADCPSNTR